jgi:hypothetical protein
MATDEHYNEPGELPKPLEDHSGTDMPATRGILWAIVVVAILGLITIGIARWFW